MNIVYVIDSLHRGGKERRLVELINSLRHKDNVGINLILLKDRIEFAEVHKFDEIKIFIIQRKKRKDISVFWKFYRLIKTIKPDLIHSWGSFAPVVAIPACVLLKIKLVNSIVTSSKIRFLSDDYIRSRLTIPFSSVVLGNSYAGLKAFHVPAKKGKVVYNGYNFCRNIHLHQSDIREKFGISTRFIIGMVAAFHKRKDYNSYIRAAKEVLSEFDDVTFLCIGDGEQMEQMKSLNKEINRHPEKIIFTGRITNIEALINICSLGVLTTNTKHHLEGISNAVIEFMAQGKPVIATEGGGTNEIIDQGENGYLIPPFEINDLAEKILLLLKNPLILKKLGVAAKIKIEDQFGIDQMVTKTYECYKGIGA